MFKVDIENNWKEALRQEFSKDYFQNLTSFVQSEYQNKKVFPPVEDIFAAFKLCPIDKVKVVILGQDPYHGLGQAHGLCFSVKDPVPPPPSLVNIYKELKSDLGQKVTVSGDLTHWARQGVFLLNAILTVVSGHAGSHQKKGWEEFTDQVIQILSEKQSHLVFMLWGAYAQKKGRIIDRSKHLVLEAPHPSPLSAHRGFFGCRHFSRANTYLTQYNKNPIHW